MGDAEVKNRPGQHLEKRYFEVGDLGVSCVPRLRQRTPESR